MATIARKQRQQLTKLWGDKVARPEVYKTVPAPLSMSPPDLKHALSLVKPRHLLKHGIDEHSTSWSRLCEAGALISSFGQLSPDRCAQIEGFLKDMMGGGDEEDDHDEEDGEEDDEQEQEDMVGRGGGEDDAFFPPLPRGYAGGPEGDDDDAYEDVFEGGVRPNGSRNRRRRSRKPFDELGHFVSFIRSHPGQLYRGDRLRHEQLMMAVVLSPRYTVLKRTTIEAFANHRYLAHEWVRTQPLYALPKPPSMVSDGEGKGGKPPSLVVVRPAGIREVTRFRKAPGAVRCDSQGLGITAAGGSESEARGTLSFELGRAARVDGGGNGGGAMSGGGGGGGGDLAKGAEDGGYARGAAVLAAGAHMCFDIEKVLVEADCLNSASGVLNGSLLQGEASHEVSQDPNVSGRPAADAAGGGAGGGAKTKQATRRRQSSKAGNPKDIPKAAAALPAGEPVGGEVYPMTQIARGGIEMWPALRLVYRPTYVAAIGAHVDLVRVGDQPDAVRLTIVTPRAAHPPIVSALCELRMHLYRSLGGRPVDFSLTVSPRGEGSFLIAISPVSALEWDSEVGSYVNPTTGESLSKLARFGLPMSSIDAAQARGHLLIEADEARRAVVAAGGGEAAVRQLYDFSRLPGASREISNFFRAKYGVRLEGGTGRCEDCAPSLFPKGDPSASVFTLD